MALRAAAPPLALSAAAPEQVGQRVAALYQELGFPSAARLQAALRKEGIPLSLQGIRELTAETGAKQIFQPPPRSAGHITAVKMDDRWAADLIDFTARPAKRANATFRHVLIVQDIFSRFIWTVALSNKTQVRRAFEDILAESGRTPRELNSDQGTEFKSIEFQTMLARRKIQWQPKEGLNDIATVDAAIRSLKQRIARRAADEGTAGDWLSQLKPATDAHNKLDHAALFESAPREVEGNDSLRFQLRYDNARDAMDNVEQAQERKDRLQNTGSFRVLLNPTAPKRRADVPNWSSKVHKVGDVTQTHVRDTEGNRFNTRLVQPVAAQSSAIAQESRGAAPRDQQRRQATLRFMPALLQIVRNAGDGGIAMSLLGRQMNAKEGFKRTLREQRMSFKQLIALHAPSFRLVGRGNATRISASEQDVAQRTRERPDGTLMQYQRLRPLRDTA